MTVTFNDRLEAEEYKKQMGNEGKLVVIKKEGKNFIASITGTLELPTGKEQKQPLQQDESDSNYEEALDYVEYIKDDDLRRDLKTYYNLAHGRKANHYAIERLYNKFIKRLEEAINKLELAERIEHCHQTQGGEAKFDKQADDIIKGAKRVLEDSKKATTLSEKIIAIDTMWSLGHCDWGLMEYGYPNAEREDFEAVQLVLDMLSIKE